MLDAVSAASRAEGRDYVRPVSSPSTQGSGNKWNSLSNNHMVGTSNFSILQLRGGSGRESDWPRATLRVVC